jgi:hypothetical protein
MDEARQPDREPTIEPRASDLQIQIEQVSVALQQLRHTQESLNSLESKLTDMTRECAGILDGWAKSDEKHATAVVELHSRLSEWNDIERHLLNESTTRIHQFERSLQHEWTAIRQAHEEPIRQLDVQTTRVTEACLTAVDQALRGFDRAETRLASLEQELFKEIGTLSREVRDAVADLRQGTPQLGSRQPWSIDNVVRLHSELRGEAELAGQPALAGAGSTLGLSTGPSARGSLALAGSLPIEAESDRRRPAETPEPGASINEGRPRPAWRSSAVVAAAIVVIALASFGVYVQSQMQAVLQDAAARADAAERGASQARAETREQLAALQRVADRRVQAAEDAARSAQALAAITAASDLKRFDLLRKDHTVAAQALWSRSEGVAFSAPYLPAAPDGKVYQLWLIGPDRATSVGVLPQQGAGRVSANFPPPAVLPRPVVRASITVEPASGSSTPTSAAYLLSPAGPSSAPSASSPPPAPTSP